jgi:N-acetylglucosamine-6-phosphate deacetylase
MKGPPQHAVAASSVFDGTRLRDGCAVVIEGSCITGIVPNGSLPVSIPVRHMPESAWLAPGFIDTQVNGGGDVLFNDAPTPEGIATIIKGHRRFGTTSLMPTFLSDSEDKTRQALSAVQTLVGVDAGVLGIHFEGPFLSPDKAGVHDPGWIRSPQSADVEMLTSLQGGVTLVTLAPERVPPGFVPQLAGVGVRVSLGHSMATYAQTRLALSQGLTGFTHLFNAIRPLASREPGPIAAALEEHGAWFGIIVDSEHVAPAMLRLALRGEGRPMLVTVAMSLVGGGDRPSRSTGGKLPCAMVVARRATAHWPAPFSIWRVRCATACVCSGCRSPRHCVSRPPLRPPSSASRTGSAISRPDIAPTWWRSIPTRSGYWRPGSPARARRARVTIADPAHKAPSHRGRG